MSRRFGCNQKRRMREELADANMRAIRFQTAYEMMHDLSKQQRAMISDLKDALEIVKQVLPEFSAALPPRAIETDMLIGDEISLPGCPPLSTTFFTGAPPRLSFNIDRLKIMVASIKDSPIRTGKHVIVKFDGLQWGYAIDDVAIQRMPRDMLVRNLTHNLAVLIAQELKAAA